MGAIHYEAVFSNGEYKTSNALAELIREDDCLFFVKKEEGYYCNTYSHYKAIVVDAQERPTQAVINKFRFDSFEIYGNASDYQLRLPYYTPDGSYNYRVFREDISYNHPGEGFSRIKPEWSISTQYKDIFSFFDNVAKYGNDGCSKILELEREAYAKDAAYRQEKAKYDSFKNCIEKVSICIRELAFPEGWTDIYEWEFDGIYIKELLYVFIPASIKWISRLPFCFCDDVKHVFCYAEEPPRIGQHYKRYSPDTTLFVPKDNLDKYTNDAAWSEIFPIIKGF